MQESWRIKWIDNLKGIGIILVLIGHFIEPFTDTNHAMSRLFIIIYSFHMPLFCLLSGLVAKKNLRRIFLYYIWIYLISQILYLIAVRIHLTGYDVLSNRFYDSYILPFWHLWYLHALIIWSLSLYVINWVEKLIPRWLIMAIAIIASIGCGFINVEKPYGMMRVVTFYPFYLSGYLYKDFLKSENWGWKPKLYAGAILIGIFCLIGEFAEAINLQSLFNYQSYLKGSYHWHDRVLFLLIGMSLSYSICILFNGLKSLLLEFIGNNSLYIFINHALLFWYLREDSVFIKLQETSSASIVAIITSLVLLCISIFSNRWVRNILDTLYSAPSNFIARISSKIL